MDLKEGWLGGAKMRKSVAYGFLGSLSLLIIFVSVVIALGGFEEVAVRLSRYGVYIFILVLGFGAQVGIYVHIKKSGKALAATGSTSGLAMISCCSHYLISFLPILGVAGVSGMISSYQTEIFLTGIFFNFLGILHLVSEIENE